MKEVDSGDIGNWFGGIATSWITVVLAKRTRHNRIAGNRYRHNKIAGNR